MTGATNLTIILKNMLPLETELMPALDKETILRGVNPFSLSAKLDEMKEKFSKEFNRRSYHSAALQRSIDLGSAALGWVTGVMATGLKDSGCHVETEEIIRRGLMYQRSPTVEDLLQLEDGIPTVRSLAPSESVPFLAAHMTFAAVDRDEGWGYCVTPWERLVLTGHTQTSFLAFNSESKIVPVANKDGARSDLTSPMSYAYYLAFVGREICRQLAGLMVLSSRKNPEYVIKDFVNAALPFYQG